MKTYIVLFLALVAAICGMMFLNGNARAICQYILFGVAGISVFVLVTGMVD